MTTYSLIHKCGFVKPYTMWKFVAHKEKTNPERSIITLKAAALCNLMHLHSLIIQLVLLLDSNEDS